MTNADRSETQRRILDLVRERGQLTDDLDRAGAGTYQRARILQAIAIVNTELSRIEAERHAA